MTRTHALHLCYPWTQVQASQIWSIFSDQWAISSVYEIKSHWVRLRDKGQQVDHHHHWSRCPSISSSCPTLCNPMDCTVHGILQAKILECVAFHFSRGSSQARDQTQVSHIAGRYFTRWASRESPNNISINCIILVSSCSWFEVNTMCLSYVIVGAFYVVN